MGKPSGERTRQIFQRLDQTADYPYPLSIYVRRFCWLWVQATLVRFSPLRAYGWRRFWLRCFGASINTAGGTTPTTKVTHPWLLTVGEFSVIAAGATIYNLGPVHIGDHTVLSQDVYVCAGTHDYRQPHLPLVRPSVRIGHGVWICAGAFIGPGVTIGDNSIIGARAVVTADVPPGVIVAGNPARVVKPRPMPLSE